MGVCRLARIPWLTIAILLTLVFGATGAGAAEAPVPAQRTFASPEEAVQALVAAVKAGNTKALAGFFVPELGRSSIPETG